MAKGPEIDAEPHEYSTFNEDLRAFIAKPNKRSETGSILVFGGGVVLGFFTFGGTPAGYIVGSFFSVLTGIAITLRFLPAFIKRVPTD